MKKKRTFTKKHVKACLARLKQYEAILAEKDFEKVRALGIVLRNCLPCKSVDYHCKKCALGSIDQRCYWSHKSYSQMYEVRNGLCETLAEVHSQTRKRYRYLRDRFKREGIL